MPQLALVRDVEPRHAGKGLAFKPYSEDDLRLQDLREPREGLLGRILPGGSERFRMAFQTIEADVAEGHRFFGSDAATQKVIHYDNPHDAARHAAGKDIVYDLVLPA